MMKKIYAFLWLSALYCVSMTAQNPSFGIRFTSPEPNYNLIPAPVSLQPGAGIFNLMAVPSAIALTLAPGQTSSFFYQYLLDKHKITLQLDHKKSRKKKKVVPPDPRKISYIAQKDGFENPEGYSIDITPEAVEVRAGSARGFFYADQTLIQLVALNAVPGTAVFLPCAHIEDTPRFSWRGMHLDESRHFFGKTFVKQYLDHLASLKMNVFHWHLTDAQGWRIEIKKYPKLTSIGAWRPDRTGFLNSDADTARTGEPMTYGGFYTQADIREILDYASARCITVLPEIEMPGHTTAALVAYPEYSCTGGPFPMPGGAKNCPYPNFCVGNEATIGFLQDILTEVIALFPSSYIHIGGDEVERNQWKSCARCQQRKKDLGLLDEAQLQVDFTKRIEDFIRSKGRQLMGWDEIMEGGNLSPSAGVMVWRGENLVQEATAAGHEVVITHPYYFDLYQGNPLYEPVSYGYKPLKDVYVYEPVPTTLSASQKARIRGVQGCLWSENLYNTRDVEYMLFPRVLALAEVAWSPASSRNWPDFTRRLPAHLALLEQASVHFATSIYNPYPEIKFDSTVQGLVCRFEQQLPTGDIRYTLDGTRPTSSSPLYTQPIALTQAADIQALMFKNNQPAARLTGIQYRPSLASGKPFRLKHAPATQYNGLRPETLTDGLKGSLAFHDGNWCGFYGDDIDITIDLKQVETLRNIRLNCLEVNASWIYLPTVLRIEISADGQQFTAIKTLNQAEIQALQQDRIKNINLNLEQAKARYIRIFAQNPGVHPLYPDGKCWLFMDEIEVN